MLFAIFMMALFLDLSPLLSYPIWGSDTGEYYYLTSYLVNNGHLLLNGYQGWGFAYQEFPGIFILGGAVAGAYGASPLISLEIVVPFIGALATFPLFLLFRRMFERDSVALLAAAIGAVLFPRLFILAHPVPDTLGDFLAIGALWMFVEQRRDVRWFVPLILCSLALVISHHLSSYFFLISAAGIVTGLELITPKRWSVRFPAREYAFLAGFSAVLFAYWIDYAIDFRSIIEEGVPFIHLSATGLGALLAASTMGLLLLLAFMVHLRRTVLARTRSIMRAKWPTRFKVARDATILSILVFGGAAVLVFFPIPGTGQKIPAIDLLFFAPLLAIVPLSAGGISVSAGARLGPAPYAWLIALLLSATAAAITNSQALPVERHTEYVVAAFSLIAAMGFGSLVARADRSWRTLAPIGVCVVLLLAANAYIAFPPPQLSDGFQEGFTVQDVALAQWGAVALPAGTVLASDHRLSDLYFGFSGNPATWSTTCSLFLGNSSECPYYPGTAIQAAFAELNSSFAPHTLRPVDVVAIDSTMVTTGVALDPSQEALPLNQSMLTFLEGTHFALIYQNGEQEIWLFTGDPVSSP